jgi:hypothetical protein
MASLSEDLLTLRRSLTRVLHKRLAFLPLSRPNLFKPGNRQLSVTVSHSGLSDPVMGNNTRMLTVVSAPPVASSAEVTGFPYAEDFEASDGNWTAFQYSADATANPMIFSRIAPTLADPEAYIVGAASGMQAWRTYTPTQAMTPDLGADDQIGNRDAGSQSSPRFADDWCC